MAHRKKPVDMDTKVDAVALSKFAYQKTDLSENPAPEKPFGSDNYKRMKKLLMKRVKPNRYVHSLSVAKTARKIARAYELDDRVARMAGLLHDWDKNLMPEHLARRVKDYQLPFDSNVVKNMPWILHGPTAAAVLADQFPELGSEVCQAIARHTVGAVDMTDLDMIVFVADKLEPTHDVEEYKLIAQNIGAVPLEDLFFQVLREGIAYLIREGRPLCPQTVTVWNAYCAKRAHA